VGIPGRIELIVREVFDMVSEGKTPNKELIRIDKD
jgi:hypothetical protein